MKNLENILIAASLIIAILFCSMYLSEKQLVGNFNPTGGGTYLLQSSISSTQTTLTLTSFTEPGSGIPYTMSYINTDIIYGTIAPSSGRSEFIAATGITQNSNGTATLTGLTRGLLRTPGSGGCVASSTLATGWSGQTQFILSNSACFYKEFLALRTAATSSAVLTFGSTTPPRYDNVGRQGQGTFNATTSELASVAYVNAVAIAGASNATEAIKGIVELGTALEQGSSTVLGGTGAGLVAQTKNATDTPQSGCASGYTATAGAGCSVIALLTGKIKQTWLNLTDTFTWTALHTFGGGFISTASSTINASTTLAANIAIGKGLCLNAVCYTMPAAQGGSGQSLNNNGSGILSWGGPPKFNVAGASGASSATSFATSTPQLALPANTLTASSTIDIYFNATASAGGGGGNQTCTFYLRSSTGATLVSFSDAASPSNSFFGNLHLIVTATSTTNSQQTYVTGGFFQNSSAGWGSSGSGSMGTIGFSGINFANAVTLTLVVQGNNGNAGSCSIGDVQYLVNP